jgi:tRNA(Ile)-lysidine synthase
MHLNRLSCNIPTKCFLAFSGGADSLGALGFLMRGKRNVELLHFNHGTTSAEKFQAHTQCIAERLGLTLHVGKLLVEKPTEKSAEEWWRESRYAFFEKFEDRPIITAHHLDDCIETYVFNSLHGKAGNIGVTRGNVIRPFLSFQKMRLHSFMPEDIQHIEDPSNQDTRFARNRIRHCVVPELLKINPGFHKVVLRSLTQQ